MKSARIAISLAFLLAATNMAAAATCPAPALGSINYGSPGAYYGNGSGVGGSAAARQAVAYDYAAFCNQPGRDGKARTAGFIAGCIKAATVDAAAAASTGGGQAAAPTRAASGSAITGSGGAAGGGGSATPTSTGVPCTPDTPVAGICGSAVNGRSLASFPTGNALCDSGTPTPVSGDGPWNWACAGSGGGASNYCSAEAAARPCPAATVHMIWYNPGATVTFPSLADAVHPGGIVIYQLLNSMAEESQTSPYFANNIAFEAARTIPGYAFCTPTQTLSYELVGGGGN